MRRVGTFGLIGAAAVATGAFVAGCSGGSGGSSGGGGVSLPPVDAVGPLTSALPSVNRGSYSYQSYQLNNIQGSGTVSALGAAPVGTQSIAIHAPLNQISRVTGFENVIEDSLAARAGSIASSGTMTVAATGDVFRSGAGDLYRRRDFNGNGNWQVALDTNMNEASVALVGSDIYALIGGEDETGAVYMPSVANVGSFSQVASLGDVIGTAACQFEGQVYIGGMDNALGGGAATLQRLVGASAVEIDLPFASGGGGVRQMVTSMLTVQYDSVAATSSATEVMILAIGSFDRSVDVGLGGLIVATDGVDFEIMQRFDGEAPTALAFMDNTIYVATDGGKLQYRDTDGTWIDDPSLPAGINGIHSMLVRGDTTLQLGCAGDAGAILFVREGGSGPSNPTADTFYLTDIKPILTASCTACHSNTGIVTQASQMQLSLNLDQDTADHAAVRQRADLANPAMSTLLRKSTGAASHTGGAIFADTSPQYATMLRWIEQGAPLQATATGGTPTPTPTQTFVTYVADVAPILAATNCNSCHNAGRALTLLNPADATADFNAFRAYTDPVVPAQSQALRKATGIDHPVTLFAAGSTQYNTIVQWINDGRRFQ